MFYSFLGLIELLWAPTHASQQKGTGVSIFPAAFLLLCQLHLGWTFAESCWEPPRRGSPTPSPEGHKPSPPLPALTCQSLTILPDLWCPLRVPPQHGHTHAHTHICTQLPCSDGQTAPGFPSRFAEGFPWCVHLSAGPLRALCFPEKYLFPEILSVSLPCSGTKLLSLGTWSYVMNLANNFKMTVEVPARED